MHRSLFSPSLSRPLCIIPSVALWAAQAVAHLAVTGGLLSLQWRPLDFNGLQQKPVFVNLCQEYRTSFTGATLWFGTGWEWLSRWSSFITLFPRVHAKACLCFIFITLVTLWSVNGTVSWCGYDKHPTGCCLTIHERFCQFNLIQRILLQTLTMLYKKYKKIHLENTYFYMWRMCKKTSLEGRCGLKLEA